MLEFLFQFCHFPAVTSDILAFSLAFLTCKMGMLSRGVVENIVVIHMKHLARSLHGVDTPFLLLRALKIFFILLSENV